MAHSCANSWSAGRRLRRIAGAIVLACWAGGCAELPKVGPPPTVREMQTAKAIVLALLDDSVVAGKEDEKLASSVFSADKKELQKFGKVVPILFNGGSHADYLMAISVKKRAFVSTQGLVKKRANYPLAISFQDKGVRVECLLATQYPLWTEFSYEPRTGRVFFDGPVIFD